MYGENLEKNGVLQSVKVGFSTEDSSGKRLKEEPMIMKNIKLKWLQLKSGFVGYVSHK